MPKRTIKKPSEGGTVMFGFDAELEREMHKLLIAFAKRKQPGSDAEQYADAMIGQQLAQLQKLAELPTVAVKDETTGEVTWSPEIQKELGKIGQIEIGLNLLKTINEFDLKVPEWTQPIVDEMKAGTASPVRSKLLSIVVLAKLIQDLT